MNRNQIDGANLVPGELQDPNSYRPTFHVTENKYPKARALAAAFWLSYFALHWLLILDVVEFTTGRAGATIFFLVAAILVTMITAALEEKGK